MNLNQINKNNIKSNVKILTKLNHIGLAELLKQLELPKNYLTVIGVVRLCNYFNLKIDDIVFKKL